MTEQLIDKLAEHGITGLLLAVSLVVIYKLYVALEKARKACSVEVDAVQKARFEDHEKFQAKLLEVVQQSTVAITNASNAADSQMAASGELRSSFDKFAEEVRRNRR